MAAPMKSMGLGHHFLRRYVWFHQQPPRFSTFPALKRQIDTPLSDEVVSNSEWKVDPDVDRGYAEERFTAKCHPGTSGFEGVVRIPNKLGEAITAINDRYPIDNRVKRAQDLEDVLWKREVPVIDEEMRSMDQFYRSSYLPSGDKDLSDETKEKMETKIQRRITKREKYMKTHWKALEYNSQRGLLYMNGKLYFDYASLVKIFAQIATRVPDFTPKTLFDFGSGLGSSIWAANYTWNKSLREHVCVDTSAEMIQLAQNLLQGGDEDNDPCFPGVFFRQYVPFQAKSDFDLVVSAFSLFDLKSLQERCETILNLWEKTGQFLVIVENGTYEGFEMVSLARDLIVKKIADTTAADVDGHIFAPCPHQMPCPKITSKKLLTCNTLQRYLHSAQPWKDHGEVKTSCFSYVVLRKGTDPQEGQAKWPRCVVQPVAKSKHVHCYMCTQEGRIEHAVFTKTKTAQSLRHIVSKSNVGDLIPAFRKEESEVIRKVGRKKRRRKSSEETEQTESDTEVDASSKNKNEEAQVHL